MEGITKEQEERLLLYATYTILYLNDTACFAVQQLGRSVKEKDKESQKIYEALLKRSSTYLKQLSSIIQSNIDYYCDYCTGMDDRADEAYTDFKKSLVGTYNKYNIEDFEYMSEVETMRSMVELSVEGGLKIINDVSKHTQQAKYLEKYLLVDMMRVANNFSNWSYRKVPKDVKIDFNKDNDVMIKFHELSKILLDYFSFDAAYRNAVKLELERKNEKSNE